MAKPKPSPGSSASNDVLTGDGPFVGKSLYGDAFSIQDFAVRGNDVTRAGWARVLVTEFSWLPAPERIQRYLVMAKYARWEAAGSREDPVRQSYLFIAEQWEKFALDLALDSARMLQIDMPSKPGPKHQNRTHPIRDDRR